LLPKTPKPLSTKIFCKQKMKQDFRQLKKDWVFFAQIKDRI